jgi:UDP-glucose 4-epimerase
MAMHVIQTQGDGERFGSLRGSRALITGGAGFIGSHIAEALVGLGAEVRVLDDLSGGHRANVPSGATFIHGSILDEALLAGAINGCTHVFHQAAMVSVPASVNDPAGCVRLNVAGTEGVLRAARAAGVRRVMFAASAAAYGNEPPMPTPETAPVDVRSPYAMSKVAGELLMTTYARCYGLSTISLRYFNIFGPRQDPKSPYAAVISAFLDALQHGRTPRIFGDGGQTRDFTPVANVVRANLLAATSSRPLAGEVVNIGTGRRTDLLTTLHAIAGALGVHAAPQFEPVRAGDVRHSVADISAAKALLEYTPVTSFDEGIAALVASVRA